MSWRKEFRRFTVCLTGRVMTVYDKSGRVLRRNVYSNENKAHSVFMLISAWGWK